MVPIMHPDFLIKISFDFIDFWMIELFNIYLFMHHKSKQYKTTWVHPYSSRGFQQHQLDNKGDCQGFFSNLVSGTSGYFKVLHICQINNSKFFWMFKWLSMLTHGLKQVRKLNESLKLKGKKIDKKLKFNWKK